MTAKNTLPLKIVDNSQVRAGTPIVIILSPLEVFMETNINLLGLDKNGYFPVGRHQWKLRFIQPLSNFNS